MATSFKNVFSHLTEKYGIPDNHNEDGGKESEGNMAEEYYVGYGNENEHIIEETNMEFSDSDGDNDPNFSIQAIVKDQPKLCGSKNENRGDILNTTSMSEVMETGRTEMRLPDSVS